MRAILKGVVLAAFVMLLAECLRVFAGANFGCVVPGECYRSSQPSPALLAALKRLYGIRSVINLRDENEDDAWYQAEKQSAQELGIPLIDAGLWSKQQTDRDDFRRVVRLIDAAPAPTLIHCASGSDRTGLASAIYLLLRTDTPLDEARRQLHLRYGHFWWTATGCLDRTLENYAGWLIECDLDHRPEHFRFWVEYIYDAQ